MTAAILEIAKMLLGAYFSYARLNGATEEEIDTLYKEGKEEFLTNTSDKLVNVD